jgi:hypothetical protein
MFRKSLCAVAALTLALASVAAAPEPVFTYTPAIENTLGHISADSLRGNLSFISSDLLEGRDTPSRGLDIAAEYIAAQFRKAGLEPVGDDGYFQTAPYLLSEARPETFELKFESAGQVVTVTRDVGLQAPAGLKIERAGAAIASMDESAPLPKPEDVAGKVLFAEWPSRYGSGVFARLQALRALKPALLVMVDRTGRFTRSGPARRLVDPEDRAAGAPWVSIRSGELAKAVHAQAAGAAVSVRLEASKETPVKLRNVVGLLRGSDPVLKDTYVLVTAHYDHVGVKPNCTTGDCIYNGANDDGSGTVSVIEIANALASMKERPRRSIVFMTVFGEEKGGYGSRYYAQHPIFPLEKTVADVNLEQLGRTDASDGPQVGTATFTGFEFSDLPAIFAAAGRFTGVKVYKSGPSDDYFSRSDNQMFANAGIPAHTMSVAYDYPDYHAVGDSWDKIDYANLAKVDRMVALGVLMLADGDAPRWNEANPKTASYVKAWKGLHRGAAAAAAGK